MPSRSVGSGRQALTKCWECSVGPVGVSGVVGIPSQTVGSGLEALPECWEWSAVPPAVSGVVGIPFRMSRVLDRTSRSVGSGGHPLP